ncbi:MAG: Rieske (2Fe-2S) protein [Desulfobacteraceae bacterium]|jgi:cytochrome b6-f complex iron-sulfur subunit
MTKHKKTKNKHGDQSSPPSSRRSFLNILWTCLGIVAFVEVITVIINFISPGRSRKRPDKTEIIEAGNADSFQVNSVTANIQGKFYLCRMEDGGFLALSSKCTHLGCTVPWVDKDKRFACPCHGSTFDITGNIINSPAPRPLDMYKVNIENNVVKVDISKSIKREKFDKKQVVYTKKVLK